ncbi:MAG TPA: ABC-2 transporter permease [Defluviitaleaceae bacterium]|jgi:ABC-2 type transport system permease protein|nr:ABC-2 transporter permease [Candidatus Epulonipiscium sp.]HOA80490.1 ABC-2 transporter permease [Defluviitaleaceae bacterium]
MAGLFEKDIRLLLRRKQTLVLFLALAVVIGFTQEGTFILGYLPFLGMMLTISTISYDEIDNGYTFLMTLPIDTKTYVKEKYLLCLSGTFISWIFAVVLYFASKFLRETNIVIANEVPIIVSFLPVLLLAMAIMIPIQLKFGAEKSRIVLLIIFGITAILSFLFEKVIGAERINSMIIKLDNLNGTVIGVSATLFVILAAIISYVISCKVMQNKEL